MNLNQVTLPSRDIARSISFYERLGMQLIVKALPHYARFECPEGDSTFSVHLVEEPIHGAGCIIYFETGSLDEWVAELQNSGIEFNLLPTDQRWLWREASLKDPDGNQLVLYFAGENRKSPPWRIN